MSSGTTFGEFVRRARNRANLGLREAARQLEISASYLSRIEAGELRAPSGAVLHRLATLYRLDVKLLLDSAKARENEMIAADFETAPYVQAFYRLAHDQSPDVQKRMIEGAIDALDMSDDQKKILLEQFRAALSRSHGDDLPRRALGRDDLFALDVKPRHLSRIQIRQLAQRVLAAVFGANPPLPIPIEEVVQKYDPNIVLVVREETEGGRLRDGSPAVLGCSRWSRDGLRRELVVHEELFEATTAVTHRRANFTLAHELFHCIEHLLLVQQSHDSNALPRKLAFASLSPQLTQEPWYSRKPPRRTLFSAEDWREWQANQFAAELLMPADMVTDLFEDFFGMVSQRTEASSVYELADVLARASLMSISGEQRSLVDTFDVNPQAMAIRLVSLGLVTAS